MKISQRNQDLFFNKSTRTAPESYNVTYVIPITMFTDVNIHYLHISIDQTNTYHVTNVNYSNDYVNIVKEVKKLNFQINIL